MKQQLKELIKNPFDYVAGIKSLLIGIAIILATAVLGFFSQTHLNGVLDVHIGKEANLLFTFIIEGITDWLCMAIVLYSGGLLISKSKIRLIDVFGTQALAREPMLIVVLLSLPISQQHVDQYLEWKLLGVGDAVSVAGYEFALFGLFVLGTIAATIWMVSLMYKAFSVSCNVKGTKAITAFIVGIIMAEALSKYLLFILHI